MSSPNRRKREPSAVSAHLRGRTIIHIDLDCFYVMVEHIRLNIPKDRPLCVLQWNGLIAVNYAARAAGIRRHSSPAEAKELCPEVEFVHVATYATGETVARYHDSPDPKTHKVSLDVYRAASKNVFNIFKRYAAMYDAKLERASIDEAYFDVSDEVNKRILDQEWRDVDVERGPLVKWDGAGFLYGVDPQPESRGWQDVQLALAADVALEIRTAVTTELGYTLSAGIAQNKTLAKLCSSQNKPNKQTVMRPSEVEAFMKDMPFNKIRGLGGKLGEVIESEFENVETAGELWKYSEVELKQKLGDDIGVWLYDICRGTCHVSVNPRTEQKGMQACKSLRPPVRNDDKLRDWVGVLAAELWPKTFTLNISTGAQKSRSKSCPFPIRHIVNSPDVLLEKAMDLLKSDHKFPCFRIAIGAQGLIKEETDNRAITNFFKPQTSVEEDEEMKTTDEKRDPTVTKCDKCNKLIPIVDVEEHNDWHFAMSIHSTERSSSITTNQMKSASKRTATQSGGSSSSSASKKKKNSKIVSSETNNKIKKYLGYQHVSQVLGCDMKFTVFLPLSTSTSKCPAVYFLSGLTCTDENFPTKSTAFGVASDHQIALISPDTSPRGVPIPGDSETWSFGVSAGFYLDATKEPWSKNYKMYSYIVDELYKLVLQELPIDADKISIMGHSMGGHGALTIGLKNPDKFKSISAFSPVSNPTKTPWGIHAFKNYLGEEDQAAWKEYDSCEVVAKYSGPLRNILIDQGTEDSFLEKELKPENFAKACEGNKNVNVDMRMQEGYDHSYWFIQTFIEEHLDFHIVNLTM
ncbi:hypothetical protein SmJEL517_g03706 [Synchytrium microbalum]|uniref:DNA polymerase eta n=1 Tax=Synchytrium microbalum TaxID=1806994 RepID=A0A507C767_9FUNG|nr:uncharacterized protein SmJEL517_g03706 [Synchytrium microbalum]TPX33373.1 hypothetical protein SmJEL517_g03706 [Synchytrium microbalum]